MKKHYPELEGKDIRPTIGTDDIDYSKPTNPEIGDMWYRENNILVWTGKEWVEFITPPNSEE